VSIFFFWCYPGSVFGMLEIMVYYSFWYFPMFLIGRHTFLFVGFLYISVLAIVWPVLISHSFNVL
jgi:hypothetical protein